MDLFFVYKNPSAQQNNLENLNYFAKKLGFKSNKFSSNSTDNGYYIEFQKDYELLIK